MKKAFFLAFDLGAESGRTILGRLENGRILTRELTGLADEASPFGAFINPDSPDFLNLPSMPEAIRAFCRRTGQRPPLSPSETVRCILESQALKYRRTLHELVRLTGKSINRIHVIGGGSRNERLCQFTADAALAALRKISISLPCWQGDDVRGFEKSKEPVHSGGIKAADDYPGRARTVDELRQDLKMAFSLIPAKHRVNLPSD